MNMMLILFINIVYKQICLKNFQIYQNIECLF
jgi:hypothetical protein